VECSPTASAWPTGSRTSAAIIPLKPKDGLNGAHSICCRSSKNYASPIGYNSERLPRRSEHSRAPYLSLLQSEPKCELIPRFQDARKRFSPGRRSSPASPGTYDQKHVMRVGNVQQYIANGLGIPDQAHLPRSGFWERNSFTA